ncbi:hypothetical protein LX32DRAFT_417461 [Colletotrichum zoysiae]|uniref:Uncharacterized protein n=1 Tax=Colletotrichum zoysiae TaxID=1216348 RepID=A0AAD9HF45_9PEZI|nr:hypothetical protein LX32DRAFT_417461 [Colletotrichum zoysiae]
MAKKFGFFMLRSRTKRQTRRQVLVGLAQGLSVHARTQLATLSLVLVSLVFLTDTDLIYWRDPTEMRNLLRIHCGVILLRWLHDIHLAVLSGYRAAVWEAAHSIYLAPYATVAWFRSFILPKGLGGKTTTFTPTGSIGNIYQERDPGRRAPILARFRHIILGCGAWVHALAVVGFSLGAYIRISRAFRQHSLEAHSDQNFGSLFIILLRKVIWPTHPWISTTLACMVPIKYALFPPQIPQRDKLLGRKEKNGARYVVPEFKGKIKRGLFNIGFVELHSLFVLYVAVVFVATWWVDITLLE